MKDSKVKMQQEENGYKSILHKNALAYNLAYQLKNMKENDNPYLIIERTLSNFEFKNTRDLVD